MSKLVTVDKKEYSVKYPKKEKAYAFIPHNGIPFERAVVGVTYPTAEYRIERSERNRICLFEFVVSGEGEVFLDGQWQTATAGDFYILPSGQAHRYRASAENPPEKMWVNYVSDYMQGFLKGYGIEGGIYRAERARGYFEELIGLTRGEGGGEVHFEIADRVQRIAMLAAREGRQDREGEEIRSRLSEYTFRRFNFDEFAEELGMSKSSVIRRYRGMYGRTPYDDLIEMKMEAARSLLRETRLPIKEIADKVCVYDEHYFSALFLKRTGMRPGAYRRRRV